MNGKKRPLAILWYQLDVYLGSAFKCTGGGNHPLGKPCYRKRLDKTMVKFRQCVLGDLQIRDALAFSIQELSLCLFDTVRCPITVPILVEYCTPFVQAV